MEAWIASEDAKARIAMVDEALAVHEANGTQDSRLAARLRESREHYARFADKSLGDKMVVREQDSNPQFTGKSSAARATSSRKGGGNASDAALGYATSLWNQRQSDQLEVKNPIMYRAGLRMTEEGLIDPRTCSDLIDLLKALPWRQRPSTPAVERADAKGAPAALEPGYYRLGDSFYRVKISKSSGHAYAEKRVDDGWDYESGKGVARKLTAANLCTAEDAKAFGDMYGKCMFGDHPLTDQRSLDAGYGPKCAAKYGLPWG